MSVKFMSMIWEHGPANQSERFVLLALADYANDEGECWPSVDGVAAKTCLSGRGVQKILARLEEAGWLEIDRGGGRKNCNLYRVKTPNLSVKTLNPVHPEPRSGVNHVPKNPEPECKNPERGSENPEPRSPEPSRTINNHHGTINKRASKKTSNEVLDILCECASEEAARSFIAYRKQRKGGAFTVTAATRLVKTLHEIELNGGSADDALGLAEERNWLTVKPDWYFNNSGGRNDDSTGQNEPARHRRNGAGGGTVAAFANVARQRGQYGA